LPLLFLGIRSAVALIALAAFVAGVSLAVFSVQWTTTLQREVPTQVLSRVSAYDWFGSLVFLPLGMALVGPVSSMIGITTTLIGCGVLMFLLILATLMVPSVVRLTAPVHDKELGAN
jgi:hypothetical protein